VNGSIIVVDGLAVEEEGELAFFESGNTAPAEEEDDGAVVVLVVVFSVIDDDGLESDFLSISI
jgi:hypothetical protein